MRTLVFCAAALLAGCAGPGTLVASSGHHRMTARDPQSGVSVILTTEVWEAAPRNLDEEITVIHALVANMGDKPILIAPGDLELRDRRGFRYDLLDSGATFHRATQGDPTPSGAYGRGWREPYDLGRTTEFRSWDAPRQIAVQALPWGVLEPGTQMRGYLFFEPVEHTANGATLTWRLGTPQRAALLDAVFEFAVSRTK